MDGRSKTAAPIFIRKELLSWAYFQSLIWKTQITKAGKADPAARAEKAAAAVEVTSKEPVAELVAKAEAEQEDPAAAEQNGAVGTRKQTQKRNGSGRRKSVMLNRLRLQKLKADERDGAWSKRRWSA